LTIRLSTTNKSGFYQEKLFEILALFPIILLHGKDENDNQKQDCRNMQVGANTNTEGGSVCLNSKKLRRKEK
jgi:hypothetical protein